MSTRGLPKHRAEILATRLDVALDRGICRACLSVVALAIREGTAAQVRGQLCSIAPNLWYEGLAEVALAAVSDAVEQGVPDASAALSELEARGARSGVARAIVRRLAVELLRHDEMERRLAALARDRLTLAPPQWN